MPDSTELETVQLTFQKEAIRLRNIVEDGEFVTAKNKSDKRFVGRKSVIGEFDPAIREAAQPERPKIDGDLVKHRYRVYKLGGKLLRIVGPDFDTMESWYKGEGEDELLVALEEKAPYGFYLNRNEVGTILSAMPSDDDKAYSGAEFEGTVDVDDADEADEDDGDE